MVQLTHSMFLKYIIPSTLLVLILAIPLSAQENQPDPNFYIYLAFGQSNMEGAAAFESEDERVDTRFQVFQAVDCSNLGRNKENWYPATPPLARCYSGLSPADYFGRTMVEHLPDSIKVGIINVSVAGSRIELFQKAHYQEYIDSITEDWLLNIINAYDGNPYQYLVDLALKAKDYGIIKGFIMHQGESNSGDSQWPVKVKSVYDSLVVDLELEADSIPLLAGELVHADQRGAVSGMNTTINQLPQILTNSYVISSSNCTAAADRLHFDAAGYRKIGRRYGAQMLSLLGIEIELNEEQSSWGNNYAMYYEPECATVGSNWDILEDNAASNNKYVTAKVGMQHLNSASSDTASQVIIPFSIDTTGEYKLVARLNNPTYDDDSFWIKIDDGEFVLYNGLVTNGWQWLNFGTFELSDGDHSLTIVFREDGAKLDKIGITNYEQLPQGFGDDAVNICEITSFENEPTVPTGYGLKQNYPNPFNPSTQISYVLPENTNITLSLYDINGKKINDLEKGFKQAGSYILDFTAESLSSGVYIYRLTTDQFTQSRQMVLIK